MEEKFNELICFFNSVLESADSKHRLLFREILEKLAAEEKDIKKLKVEDEKLKDILKAIHYNEKIKKALKGLEPPQKVKIYTDELMLEAKSKVKEFFSSNTQEAKEAYIKEETDTYFSLTVDRKSFEEDRRIIPTIENVYRFDYSGCYDKDKQELKMSLTVSFQVKESEITGISAVNLNIFDGLAKALGFSCEPSDKNVYFNATVAENETFCDNICNVEWVRNIKSEG